MPCRELVSHELQSRALCRMTAWFDTGEGEFLDSRRLASPAIWSFDFRRRPDASVTETSVRGDGVSVAERKGWA